MIDPGKSEELKALIVDKDPEDLEMLWSAELPPEKETNPILWNELVNWFTETVLVVTAEPGRLVATKVSAIERVP